MPSKELIYCSALGNILKITSPCICFTFVRKLLPALLQSEFPETTLNSDFSAKFKRRQNWNNQKKKKKEEKTTTKQINKIIHHNWWAGRAGQEIMNKRAKEHSEGRLFNQQAYRVQAETVKPALEKTRSSKTAQHVRVRRVVILLAKRKFK